MAHFSLGFYGGTESVTGANFLLSGEGKNILIDCGLIQGCKFCEDVNREPFPYDPTTVDAVFVTHAHIDHIGRIPLLVKQGFKGVIYSTPATRELAAVMLDDSLGVLGKEAKRAGLLPLYEKEDVEGALALWKDIPYHKKTKVVEEQFEVTLKDAGHILGSAMVELSLARESSRHKKILFTGDLGNSPSPLLRETERVDDVDYVVMESVYGDRLHDDVTTRRERLRRILVDALSGGGTLMIPAFSIERTQVLLHELGNLIEEGKVSKVPVFLDSPLAIRVTDIYRNRVDLFNKGVREEIVHGDAVFDFPGLRLTKTSEESKTINSVAGPKVVIAGAGMSHGGRIQHHEIRYLPDKNSTLLLVGYQAAGSVGRILQDGAKEIEILGERVPVRAQVVTLSGYSAHPDRDGLMKFVEPFANRVEEVFVTMGETKSALFLVQRLRDFLGVRATAPRKGDVVTFEL